MALRPNVASTTDAAAATPANSLIVLIGGARSGKSDLAVHMGKRFAGRVTFVATAQRVDGDMRERIERHQAERPSWPTIEAPLALAATLACVPDNHFVIVDCLTLWLANALYGEWADDDIFDETIAASTRAAGRVGPTVAVTNEVGLGIHPDTELGRRYRDLLGRVNRIWAQTAAKSLFLVAGRAVPLHDPWEFLS